MYPNMFLSRGKPKALVPPGDNSLVEDKVPHFYDLKGLAHLNVTDLKSFVMGNRVYTRSEEIEKAMAKAFNTEIQAAFIHTFDPAVTNHHIGSADLKKSRVVVFFPNGRITVLRVDSFLSFHTEEPVK